MPAVRRHRCWIAAAATAAAAAVPIPRCMWSGAETPCIQSLSATTSITVPWPRGTRSAHRTRSILIRCCGCSHPASKNVGQDRQTGALRRARRRRRRPPTLLRQRPVAQPSAMRRQTDPGHNHQRQAKQNLWLCRRSLQKTLTASGWRLMSTGSGQLPAVG